MLPPSLPASVAQDISSAQTGRCQLELASNRAYCVPGSVTGRGMEEKRQCLPSRS